VPTPLELTREVRDISVTERQSFRTCRRQWYLGTIENLEPAQSVGWPTEFGTGMHGALESYYWALARIQWANPIDGMCLEANPLDEAKLELGKWRKKFEKALRDRLGSFYDQSVHDELLHYHDLGNRMLERYHMFARINDDFDVLAIEGVLTPIGEEMLGALPRSGAIRHESGRILVPIRTPSGRLVSPRSVLSARLDLVVYVRTPGLRGIWVLDHKNLSSAPSDKGLEYDDQVTGYCRNMWRWLGVIPRGTYYNVLLKAEDKEPRIVQANKANPTGLSTAKDQLCMPQEYRRVAMAHGIVSEDGRWRSEAHADCYSALQQRGFDPWVRRFSVPRNQAQLESFEARLYREWRDMRTVARDPAHLAYPNPITQYCSNCDVAPICLAIEDGSDYEDVIDHRYQLAEDRKA
jgi:hypothetical protein